MCERSRLEAESKCRGLHRWLSSNCHQVFIIVYWTSNTTFLPRILWLNWFIGVRWPVFSTFYCVSTSFFPSPHSLLTHPHTLLKVNKTHKPFGSPSRLYIRCDSLWILFSLFQILVFLSYSRLLPFCNSPCSVISSLFPRLQFAKLRRCSLVSSLLRKLYVFCNSFRIEN
jgi:hypothetical protein